MSGLDLVIRNGLVVDGTGARGRIADVGVADGRIVEIGRVAARAAREIDAEGHAVTPGFIDGHTHMDAQMHWDPIGTNSCWHGVTTVVMGNCGFSIAPMRRGEQHLVARNLERAEDISGAAMNAGIDWRWESFDQYLDVVESIPKGINYATYIGHSALRTWAMGERAFNDAANADDLARMKEQVGRALSAGAVGFSTSRSESHETSDDRPVASRLANWDEVSTLVGAMKGAKDAVFEIAHEQVMPGTPEGDEYYDRLGLLAIESGVTTTFGVVSRVGCEQIKTIERVAAKGGRMVGQSHSRCVSTVMSFRTSFPFDNQPVWSSFRKQPLEEQIRGLRDNATRQALVDAVKNAVYGRAIGAEARPPDWEQFTIYDRPLPPYRSLGRLAAERGVHPIEVLIDEALTNDLETLFMQPLTSVSDADSIAMMRSPHTVMTFSDSGAHVGQIADASIQSYLIAYWHRERQVFSLPEAVEMITGRAARAWGFADRGVIKEGFAADLNIFDPQTFGPLVPEVVYDLPTGARRLAQRSTGMKATIVNGAVLIEDGQHTGALSGTLLRRKCH
jgi:N-acyl-D-aspartate/D-glutamate deacylase